MQLESATGDAKQDLFSGLARKLLPPAVQYKLLTAQSLTPIERNQLIEAGRLVSGIQNALARFPGEGTLLTEEKLDEYFKTHTVKATLETPPTRGTYEEIVPIVIEVYNDHTTRELMRHQRQKMSYRKAIAYIHRSADIPLHHPLYAKIMVARANINAIIAAKKSQGKPDAEETTVSSLLAYAKQTAGKKSNKSKFPSPVAFDHSVSGGGLT